MLSIEHMDAGLNFLYRELRLVAEIAEEVKIEEFQIYSRWAL